MELSIAFPELHEEIKDVWDSMKSNTKFKRL